MPRSLREWAKRKLKMAAGCVDKAGEHLEAINLKYKEVAPEVSQFAEDTQTGVLLLSDRISKYEKDF